MTRRDDIVAALKRAVQAAYYRNDRAILRALADALREGVDDTYPIVNEHGLRAIGPVWIIPEPKVKQ